jgi:hypothetical protein
MGSEINSTFEIKNDIKEDHQEKEIRRKKETERKRA